MEKKIDYYAFACENELNRFNNGETNGLANDKENRKCQYMNPSKMQITE